MPCMEGFQGHCPLPRFGFPGVVELVATRFYRQLNIFGAGRRVESNNLELDQEAIPGVKSHLLTCGPECRLAFAFIWSFELRGFLEIHVTRDGSGIDRLKQARMWLDL